MRNPFVTTIYDKSFQRLGWLPDPVSMTITPRHNQIGTADIVVPTRHARLPDLAAAGSRVVIEYNDEHLMSGMVRMVSGTGPQRRGEVTFRVEDDLRLLWRVLGWPVPGSALTAQGVKEDKRTGNAESVLKQFVLANAVTRLGLPVSIAPIMNRGGTITVASRFQPLADRLFPAVETPGGLGVTVKQSGAGLVVDVYEPSTYPYTLTESSGVVQSWSWSKTAPAATRTVVGDASVGTSRVFRARTDTTAETAWGDKIEVFTDASETAVTAELDARGDETLADNRAKAGLSIVLAETATFRYGGAGIHVGDQVTVEVAEGTGITVTDLLREAPLTWTKDGGVQIVPTIGDRVDDSSKLFMRTITRLQRKLRAVTAR
jgi:hypothetical protein